ncbi:hypothetical protein, partial [Corynebacterium glyciniphilum]|uniref:hypothetical protein n=1 Tax=Corynebacterium glyciniphilum TaxID=1404244 RepID=UPI001642ED9C
EVGEVVDEGLVMVDGGEEGGERGVREGWVVVVVDDELDEVEGGGVVVGVEVDGVVVGGESGERERVVAEEGVELEVAG